MIVRIYDADKKEEISRSILETLPDWFGIPESTAQYICDSRKLAFWAEIEKEQVRGFVALKETSRYAAEIYVMGVRPEYHRKGIGRQLMQSVLQQAREIGYEFLQVKTVEQGHYKEYDQTNAFYKSMGFRELECLRELWGQENPCQIYVMAVEEAGAHGQRKAKQAGDTLSETWAQDGKQELLDWIEEQGIYIRE